MATYPPRRTSMLAVARKIAPQVAALNIVLNEYSGEIEELRSFDNILQIIPSQNTKDTGKFYPTVGDADYILLVDDDIDFPEDLVQSMVAELGEKGSQSVVGYHGTIYRRPPFSLKPKKLRRWARFRPQRDIFDQRKVFAFYQELKETTRVDQLGTGVVLLPAEFYPPFCFIKDAALFVDVRFARWCFEKNIKQYAAKRPAHWLKQIDHDASIYKDFTLESPLHVRKEIMSFALKSPLAEYNLKVKRKQQLRAQ